MLQKQTRFLSLSLGLVFALSSCQLIPFLTPDEPGTANSTESGTAIGETSPTSNKNDMPDITWSANPGSSGGATSSQIPLRPDGTSGSSVTPSSKPTPQPVSTPYTKESPFPESEVTPVPETSSPVETTEDIMIFENGNIMAVQNNPTAPTTFMIETPVLITYFENYHWNNAQGKPGGSMGLQRSDGTVYGPWPVTTREGQGGVPNAYWFVTPNIILPAGDYTVTDSDPSSWAHNANNGYQGMTILRGVPQ